MAGPLAGKGPLPLGHNVNRETLTGNKTLTEDDEQVQSLDPGGAARTVTLPAEAGSLMFVIVNRADAAEAITVEDDASNTIVSVAQNAAALVFSDGTGWGAILGAAVTDQT